MQNFENLNYNPEVTDYVSFPDPRTNEPFNRATQPSNKPSIATHFFAIDSRQRDYSIYPNANQYSIPIPPRYRNVTSLELKCAIIPRAEYNINSCNKYLDISLGDFISDVKIKYDSSVYYFSLNNKKTLVPDNEYNIRISPNSTSNPAEITVSIKNGKLDKIFIKKSGSGFDINNPPKLTVNGSIEGKSYDFIIQLEPILGINVNAEFREGQYIIGGNPELYVRNNGNGTTFGVQNQDIANNMCDSPIQSWVPFNLLNELESGITDAIINSMKRKSKKCDYCFNRKSVFQNSFNANIPPDWTHDYPLLFSSRLFSSYPTLDNYLVNIPNLNNSTNFDSNSCRFNRINISNNLLLSITSNNLDPNYFSNNIYINYKSNTKVSYIQFPNPNPQTKFAKEDLITYQFEIIGNSLVNQASSTNQTWLLCLNLTDTINPLFGLSQRSNFPGFTLNSSREIDITSFNFPSNVVNVKLCPYSLNFSSGENQIVNIASILGFNKYNYTPNTTINNNPNGLYTKSILANSAPSLGLINHPQFGTVRPTISLSGLTYRTENDYYLIGDPEYVMLSFRARYGADYIAGVNDRIDSQNSSNLDKVFACLIYDSTVPSVLQEISTGNNNNPIINSSGAQQNANCSTYLMNDTNINFNTIQLAGNSGTQNVTYQKTPGNLKAMKGTDFDRKLIEFPQPIAQLHTIAIKFTKFSKFSQGNDKELYDFHGKEHLLIFEISCSDFLTGKRF